MLTPPDTAPASTAFTEAEPHALAVPQGFAPELHRILDAELLAGNSLDEIRTAGPLSGTLVLILKQPFLTPLRCASPNLRFRQVNLPGWWSAEYTTAIPPHTLACR